MPVKAILFDLDDTLFDHQHSSRSGLAALRQHYAGLRLRTVEELEREHLRLLNDVHPKVMQGVLSPEQARIERFRQLFEWCGETLSVNGIQAAAERYRQAYQAARRPVPGVIPLLKALKATARIAVVTNNLAAEQREKLRCCALDPLIDALIVSQEAGVSKPDPAIFQAALNAVECAAPEAVMVGDSWPMDILGAHRAGIRPVWLNRYDLVCPDPDLAVEIKSFEPCDAVLRLLLGGRSHARHCHFGIAQ